MLSKASNLTEGGVNHVPVFNDLSGTICSMLAFSSNLTRKRKENPVPPRGNRHLGSVASPERAMACDPGSCTVYSVPLLCW